MLLKQVAAYPKLLKIRQRGANTGWYNSGKIVRNNGKEN